MDRIIEVKVSGNYLVKDNDLAGVQHESNATRLRIEFDAGWDGFAKKVTFWNALGENPVARTLTADLLEDITKSTRIYLCPIPGEAMAEVGKLEFVIDGWVDGVRQRSLPDKLKVKPSGYVEDPDEPSSPTPSQAEQLQQQIDTLLGNIQDAQVSAGEAAERAEEAASNGPKIGENKTWLVWNGTQEKYVDTGVYCGGEVGPEGPQGIQGPQGETGATGPKGEQGPEGPQGPKGDTGPQGPRGETGPQGAQGETGAIGPQGPKGDTGSGFQVLDYYDSLDALESAVSSPEPGDAYGVGTEEPYDIYIYGKTSGWKNNGPLQGAKGDTGPKGPQGETGPQGPQGEKGATGETGATGPQGPKGDPGETGPQGIQGETGPTGAAGYTPVRGKDYWTAADQQAIVDEVLAALPAAEGVSV